MSEFPRRLVFATALHLERMQLLPPAGAMVVQLAKGVLLFGNRIDQFLLPLVERIGVPIIPVTISEPAAPCSMRRELRLAYLSKEGSASSRTLLASRSISGQSVPFGRLLSIDIQREFP